MKTIYKYPLNITDVQPVLMPVNADVISVQFQGEQLCIWAVVDPDEEQHTRLFHVFGTGQPLPQMNSYCRFLGTVQQFGGKLVWHVFEQI